MSTHKGHLIPKARLLFMQGFTQKEIAEILSVSEATMSDWARDGNWKSIRDEQKNHPLEIAEMLTTTFKNKFQAAMTEDNLNNKAIDSLSKLSSMISKFGGIDDFASSAVLVCSKLMRWAMSEDGLTPDEKQTGMKIINNFLLYVNDNAF